MSDERLREVERDWVQDPSLGGRVLFERARAGLGKTYTMLWAKWQCGLRSEGEIVELMFAGSNAATVLPAKLTPGDRLVPIQVRKGEVFVVAGMTFVSQEPARDYWVRQPAAATDRRRYGVALQGTHGARFQAERRLPREHVESWQFSSPKGELRSPRHVASGLVKHTASFNGIYLLSAETESLVLGVLADQP